MHVVVGKAVVWTDVAAGPWRWDNWCTDAAVAVLVSNLQSTIWCCRSVICYCDFFWS